MCHKSGLKVKTKISFICVIYQELYFVFMCGESGLKIKKSLDLCGISGVIFSISMSILIKIPTMNEICKSNV